jgi:hypothetical protein
MILLDQVSVQDRDLLARLSAYFASIEQRIAEGQGWLIFNAPRERAGRITRLILERLAERRPFVSYYYVPWRDFALNAYMSRVELPSLAPAVPATPSSAYDIAGRVSRDQFFQMRYTDVLLLSGLAPQHRHEVEHLDAVLTQRFQRRLPTILVAPRGPDEVARLYAIHPGGEAAWRRLYDGMYASSLIAL